MGVMQARHRILMAQPHIVTPASAAVQNFSTDLSAPLKKCMVSIEAVQGGTGDPSPENIRPITGWTGAKVTRTGKNLLEPKFYTGFIYGKNVGEVFANSVVDVTESVTKNGSVYSKTGNSWNIPMCMMFDIESLAGQTITLSGFFSGSLNISNGLRSAWVFTDSNYRITRKFGSWNGNPLWTLTPQNGEKYLVWYINSSVSGTIELNQPMIELGSTASSYEPYQGETYSITFPTEAGTVYGGTLDVTNGVLTVDRAMVDIGALSWSYVPTYRYFNTCSLTGTIAPPISNQTPIAGLLCTAYKTSSASEAGSGDVNETIAVDMNKNLRIKNLAFEDAGTWKSAFANQSIVYPLATPITYHLTPQGIRTLLGTNNIWADTGDTELSYWTH